MRLLTLNGLVVSIAPMSAQTDDVWPLVWSTEDPTTVQRRADVGRGGHTVQGLSTNTWSRERNRKGVCQTDRRIDGGTLGAFVLSVTGRDAVQHCV